MHTFLLYFMLSASPGLLMLLIAVFIYGRSVRPKGRPLTQAENEQIFEAITRPSFATRLYLAGQEAKKFPSDAMSAADVMGVWNRHPDFAPGGRWFRP